MGTGGQKRNIHLQVDAVGFRQMTPSLLARYQLASAGFQFTPFTREMPSNHSAKCTQHHCLLSAGQTISERKALIEFVGPPKQGKSGHLEELSLLNYEWSLVLKKTSEPVGPQWMFVTPIFE